MKTQKHEALRGMSRMIKPSWMHGILNKLEGAAHTIEGRLGQVSQITHTAQQHVHQLAPTIQHHLNQVGQQSGGFLPLRPPGFVKDFGDRLNMGDVVPKVDVPKFMQKPLGDMVRQTKRSGVTKQRDFFI